MGGKGKNKGKHNHRSHQNNHSNENAPRLTEEDLCQLVAEATEIHALLNSRHEELKKAEEFVHVLSTKWLREWKDYVGYEDLFGSQESKGKKKMGKRKPGPPNTDLIGSTRQLFLVPENEMPEYAYLNKVIGEKLDMPEDYIAVTDQLWERFDEAYGPGQKILRPVRKLKSGKNYIDGSLLKADFFFVNYNDPELLQRLAQSKSSKVLEGLLPSNSFQMSKLWDIQKLYEFLGQYSAVYFGSNQITIWLCQNFIGVKSLQEQFAKSVKQETYKMYAYKLGIDDERLQDLDLDDFLKSQYTLIVEVADSKIVTQELPDQIVGYCEECIDKKALKFSCECNRIHYCSKECQVDDQVWHYKSCSFAFDSEDDQTYRKKKGSKLSRCGLKNLGNTCYMNSSIQLFMGLRFIVDSLCGSNKLQKLVGEDKDQLMFIQKIAKTCKQMGQVKQYESLAPWSLKGQINYFLPPFQGYKQHDAIDFLTGFLNTINESLIKPKDQAYSDIFKDNIMGQFDSLVICPSCDKQVKNEEQFMQINLPIKPKANRVFFNYVKSFSPLEHEYGRAEVMKSWDLIRQQVGIHEDGLIMAGKDGEEDLVELDIDSDEDPEKVIKKVKKDLIFFAKEKYNPQTEIWISCSFITMKSVCGEMMRAVSGFPFPLVMDPNKTVSHIFFQIIHKFIPEPELLKQIGELDFDYHTIVTNQRKRLQELKDLQETEKSEESDQIEKQKESIEEITSVELDKLDKKVRSIFEDLAIKVYIEDKKRIKNVCYFCKKKCKGCELQPSFDTSLSDFFAHKLKQSKITLHFQKKLEGRKQKVDLADNGESTLQDCLNLFGEPEQLDEENAWWCDGCQDMQLAIKQMHVKRYPKYLLIQLSRFKNGANGKVKNNQPIIYKQFETFGQGKYQLLAAIIHEGSIDGGHYWAIALRGEDYYIFNDEKVSKTDKICNKGAYILCYRQCQ